jgi:hypothetical protein
MAGPDREAKVLAASNLGGSADLRFGPAALVLLGSRPPFPRPYRP